MSLKLHFQIIKHLKILFNAVSQHLAYTFLHFPKNHQVHHTINSTVNERKIAHKN